MKSIGASSESVSALLMTESNIFLSLGKTDSMTPALTSIIPTSNDNSEVPDTSILEPENSSSSSGNGRTVSIRSMIESPRGGVTQSIEIPISSSISTSTSTATSTSLPPVTLSSSPFTSKFADSPLALQIAAALAADPKQTGSNAHNARATAFRRSLDMRVWNETTAFCLISMF